LANVIHHEDGGCRFAGFLGFFRFPVVRPFVADLGETEAGFLLGEADLVWVDRFFGVGVFLELVCFFAGDGLAAAGFAVADFFWAGGLESDGRDDFFGVGDLLALGALFAEDGFLRAGVSFSAEGFFFEADGLVAGAFLRRAVLLRSPVLLTTGREASMTMASIERPPAERSAAWVARWVFASDRDFQTGRQREPGNGFAIQATTKTPQLVRSSRMYLPTS
jgi:hypothetical protein